MAALQTLTKETRESSESDEDLLLKNLNTIYPWEEKKKSHPPLNENQHVEKDKEEEEEEEKGKFVPHKANWITDGWWRGERCSDQLYQLSGEQKHMTRQRRERGA